MYAGILQGVPEVYDGFRIMLWGQRVRCKVQGVVSVFCSEKLLSLQHPGPCEPTQSHFRGLWGVLYYNFTRGNKGIMLACIKASTASNNIASYQEGKLLAKISDQA